ncbi:MAG TPA: histone deacetylase [Herpetosiphonaceae bacterium]|nr:histone deacetylase [Herpetosiphonaceae bacterium]
MSPPSTGFLVDDRLLAHDEPEHNENARRLVAILALLERSGIRSELRALPVRLATEREIAAVHDRRLIELIQMLAYEGGSWIDGDTYVTADSWTAVSCAAGAVVGATEAVIRGEVSNAFALVRPPGHHATRSRAMGFCLVNHVAIAARYALDVLGLERLAIVDWDTHHGNGTQDIFYEDPRVLYCSSHTWPLFPGTGHWREMGQGAGHGTTLNVPMPYYSGDDDFDLVYDRAILPAVERFKPELIIVSAGYDSHWADPLAPMNASVSGYARLAQSVYQLAERVCSVRLVCALEGGYDLQALAACVLATLRVLQGHAELVEDPLGARGARPTDVAKIVEALRREHPLLL